MRGRWRHIGILILALTLATGASTVVQVAAWGGMLISRTVERGFEQAAASTFSGREPCRMCCAADSLRRAEDGDRGKPAKAPSPNAKVLKVECPAAQPVAWSSASLQTAYVLIPLSDQVLIPGELAPPEPPPPKSI
jgi:hypothetical protein